MWVNNFTYMLKYCSKKSRFDDGMIDCILFKIGMFGSYESTATYDSDNFSDNDFPYFLKKSNVIDGV